jgi:hypothetical protein
MVLNQRLLTLAKVLSASAIILLGYYILKFHNQLQLPSSLNANKTSINFRAKTQPLIEGFELIEYYKGMKVFSLKAKQLYLRNRKVEPFGFRVALGKTAELQDVDVTFFANNEPVSCLHSNKAILNQKDKSIIFQDKPFMLTKNHRSLSAKEIKWDNISRSIHAQGNCVLSGDGVSQQAESIQTDITLE